MSHPCRGCNFVISDNKIVCDDCFHQLGIPTQRNLKMLFRGDHDKYDTVINRLDRELSRSMTNLERTTA